MENYRGYRIAYGRVGENGTDGFAIYKNMKFICGAGTFSKARLCKSYWQFWKAQAMVAVDILIKKEGVKGNMFSMGRTAT